MFLCIIIIFSLTISLTLSSVTPIDSLQKTSAVSDPTPYANSNSNLHSHSRDDRPQSSYSLNRSQVKIIRVVSTDPRSYQRPLPIEPVSYRDSLKLDRPLHAIIDDELSSEALKYVKDAPRFTLQQRKRRRSRGRSRDEYICNIL